MATNEIRPQPGPQEQFLSSPADIAIYGGAAGSGKSHALILEPLYNAANGRFRAILFRRTIPQIKLQGGLWDSSEQVYAQLGAIPNQTALEWRFPSGAVIKFAGLEHDADRFNYQGAQIPLIEFDELVQFSANQFWYLLSRCRSMSGVRGYVRAATNPDPDSWVRRFLEWWIDADSGLPIKSRSGVLRWFVRMGDELLWADSRAELVSKLGPDAEPKSATFIPANVHDNRILIENDPNYLANLKALPRIDRERLLSGNWNVRATAGSYFRREWFGVVEAPPKDIVSRVRYWDRAATEKRADNDPDATIGLLLAKDVQGIYYVEHVLKMFASPHTVETAMRTCAQQDGRRTTVAYMQDPGSAGVAEAQATARALDGFNVRFATASGDKETRAKPVSAQAEAGNVKIVRGLWNDEFLRVLENFPAAKHDDEVDALSGAHGILGTGNGAFDANSFGPTPAQAQTADELLEEQYARELDASLALWDP
ncbi:MAG TPA: phage terminase large subunit [Verrucomicrobiae bacterium]|nr:phage terminase large subunit [Verrucomicrobiae bacterium]